MHHLRRQNNEHQVVPVVGGTYQVRPNPRHLLCVKSQGSPASRDRTGAAFVQIRRLPPASRSTFHSSLRHACPRPSPEIPSPSVPAIPGEMAPCHDMLAVQKPCKHGTNTLNVNICPSLVDRETLALLAGVFPGIWSCFAFTGNCCVGPTYPCR